MKMKSLLLATLATLGLTASTIAQNLPNYVSPNGLVSWWPFNGNAVDESINDNDGIVNGALLTEDRFGYINKAYKFNGINNYIEILNTPNQINNTYSISIWIENDSLSSFIPARYILNKGCSPTPSYRIYYQNDGNIEQYVTDNWSPIRKYVYGPSSNNQWTHLVSIYDGNFLKLYVNGVLFGSISQNGNITTTTENLLIGCGKNTVTCQLSSYYSGKIDDIGIWNRALNSQEISDLYNAVNCSSNTIIIPQTSNLTSGSTANFNATTSDFNPSYFWQSDFGQGFQTLNNYGNYSGVNTNSLSISNVQLQNHNQPIRVISTSGECIDTSDIAYISIIDTCINNINDTTFITVTDTLIINTTITGINPQNNSNTIKVFPNPANSHITIDYGNFVIMNGYQLKIENSLGQQVFQTNITQQSDYLNLSSWGGNGLYFVHIIDPQGNTIDIRKIVLQ